MTLVEILVGLGVLAILAAVAAPNLAGALEKRRVIAAAEEVSGILTYAKAETNATNTFLIVRFDTDPNPDPSARLSCAAVTTGAGINSKCRCYLSEATICTGGGSELLRLFQLPQKYVEFGASAVTWGSVTGQIRFDRSQMSVATDGFHVDVVGKRYGYKLRVELNTAGRVKVCSPNGDMSGYAKCA